MNRLRLVKLTQEYIPLLISMVNDWIVKDSVVYPYRIVDAYRDAIHNSISNANKIEGFGESDSSNLLFLLDAQSHKFIGAVDIRKYNSRIDSNGYINSTMAYGISPLYRGKGYGTEQLRLAINICRKLGITEINMLCNKNNIGSRKIIEANNGEFVRQIQVGSKILLEYIIKQ